MTRSPDPDDLPAAVLRRLSDARRAPEWIAPPDPLVGELLSSPERDPAPRSSEAETDWTLDWEVADVRGVGGPLEGPRVLARVFEDGELALTAEPPRGDRGWQIRGTVWVRDPSAGPVSVLLLVEDHVVGSVTTESGEAFLLEEFLPPGWSVEVHLPNGKALSVVDPGE